LTAVHVKEKNKLESKLKFYTKYKLLLNDEVGSLPIDKEDAYLFFQFTSKKYETRSTIITTNIQVLIFWNF